MINLFFYLQLSQSTQEWAEYLAQSCQFEHRPHPWPQAAQGENITTQFNNSAEKSIDMWIKSPPHNRNVSQHLFSLLAVFLLFMFSNPATTPSIRFHKRSLQMLKDSHTIMGIGIAKYAEHCKYRGTRHVAVQMLGK